MYNEAPATGQQLVGFPYPPHLSSASFKGKNSLPSLALLMKTYLQSRQKCGAPLVQQIDNDDTETVLFPQLRVMLQSNPVSKVKLSYKSYLSVQQPL